MAILRDKLRGNLPWDSAETSHTHITNSGGWWQNLHSLFTHALIAAGADWEPANQSAKLVRSVYTAPENWSLYPDTRQSLQDVVDANIDQVIISNHVPELHQICNTLDISGFFSDIVTSALVGYEKPHPSIFFHALNGRPPTHACMIGDNAVADVAGAKNVGMHVEHARTTPHDDLRKSVAAAIQKLVQTF